MVTKSAVPGPILRKSINPDAEAAAFSDMLTCFRLTIKTESHPVLCVSSGDSATICPLPPEDPMLTVPVILRPVLADLMEGPNRPGHFNGVAQIVSKLFYAVEPDRAYFGEKDFQQLAIIREMVRLLNLNIEIVGCPIVREEDGMALSSRNMLLSKAERKLAANISRTLFESRYYARHHTLASTRKYVIDTINSHQGLEVEYYEIVDGRTLQPVDNWDATDYIVGCVTVHCGKVRLIDNIKYKE